MFFFPKKIVCTIGYHPNKYIIEDLGYSWGTSLKKNVWLLFSTKGLIRHLIIWGPCIFKALTWIWFSKVGGAALPKEKRIMVDKAPPEIIGSEKKESHTRGPPPTTGRILIYFENSQGTRTLIGTLH